MAARQLVHRGRQHVDVGAAGDVVEHDRQRRRLGDRPEVAQQAVLRRLAVVRHDREDRRRRRIFGCLRQFDRMVRVVAGRSGDDGAAFARVPT